MEQKMSKEDELKGLGGWLILVGLGVVIGPFRLLFTLVPMYLPFFQDGLWEDYTSPTSNYYVPYFDLFIIGEIALNTMIISACFYLIYLFFSKSYLFPRFFIGVMLATLILIPLDAWLFTLLFPSEEMFDPETTVEFLRSVIYGAIWIPYMLVSKRVKATFVEGRPEPQGAGTLGINQRFER